MTVCMVAVEDDFTGNSSTTVSTAHQQQTPISSNFEMNPQQSSASYGHGPGPGFYGQPGPHFPGAGPGGPGQGYPGPMSPYGGPGPMSPYANQNQGPANGAGGGSMYGNQNNSPLYNNQNQSSSGYGGAPGGGPGNYTTGAGLAGYYNNHSPTHSSGHQYHQSPPPQTMGMMQLGARIPQPQNMNSPNQNVVTSNQMKTENMDLKPGPGMYSGQSVSQGYSQSSYGYNGYSGRPLVSPRLNISPGGPNHSPREVAPPNMSPHPGLYQSGQQQASPGPASFPGPGQPQHPGSYQAQYEATYFKPGGQAAQHSPGGDRLGYPGGEADKLSDAQSNAGSVRSGDGPDTPAHSSFCDDTSNPILTNLLPKKEAGGGASDTKPDNDKLSSGADSDIENKFTPKSEPDEIKPEGSYYEELTLKANQTLIDNMNIDSIPELPEIPELKYEVTDEMNRLQHNSQDGDNNKEHKETPPGLSPDCKDGTVGRAPWDEAGEEDGYHDNMGAWGQHMQEGMEGGYPGAHQMPYPNQQQMWANFYGSGGGPPGGHHPPPLPPHMAMDPAGPGGWWQGHAGPAGPDLGPYRMGGPPGGPGMPPAPGPWALRGPRPRGERRGPGRPRLTNKGDPRGENRPRSAGLPGASQFPSPYPEGLPADMMGDHKRGPGRPKALLDPNSPKVPGDTTKNGNKKRYTCEVCQKRFSTAWYVRVHRRSHNGERPYVCNNCGKGFMLPNVLQVHLRKCEKNNPPGAGGGPGSQGSLDGEAPNQSPTSVSASGGPPGFRSGGYGGPEGAMGSCPPQSYPPPPGHTGGPPGPGPYNQRYLGGMGSPPFSSGMSGDTGGGGGMPPLTTGSSFPGDPYPSMPPPPHSPHNSGTMDRSPPQFSPMYSPNSNNLPINSDTSEHHFLANDKPRDKGGGPGAGGQILGSVEATRTAPAGVDPSLYCATSDTSFEDRTAAEDHIKTHRPFSCEMCDKRFSQKCNLVTHMRLHTGDKPYKCEFCDKRFTQKGNLDAHIKTHTKEKPFQCTLCSKRFAFKSYLQSHIRSHQNGCPDTDMEEEDLDSCKENAKMAKFDNDINGLADSCNEDCDEDDEDNDPDGLSPSSLSPPPLPQFGATIQHLNTKGLNSSPENDISKLTDSRQTVAMLQ